MFYLAAAAARKIVGFKSMDIVKKMKVDLKNLENQSEFGVLKIDF